MYNDFNNCIEDLYSIIIQPIDAAYKLTALRKYKRLLGVHENSFFSDKYCSEIHHEKEKGTVYTPIEISNYMVKNIISDEDVIKNPFLKILDPACGSGNILIPCFLFLREVFIKNINQINDMHNLSLSSLDIDAHIVNNNLFGMDMDYLAIKVLIIDLFSISLYVNIDNFFHRDFLIDEVEEEFNVFIGNPPYVGHKTVQRDYSKILKDKYQGIYKDKGDISYCFFKKSLDVLSSSNIGNKKLSFITSRYFIESISGSELRKLLNQGFLEKIVDFYGIRPFKRIGIDPVIIFMDLNKNIENIEVLKPETNKGKTKKEFVNSLLFDKGDRYLRFFIKKSELKDTGWILKNEAELSIISKIENKCTKRLSDISRSYQGIITGCDKAFVMGKDKCALENIEQDIVKPWIKSSSIEKNKISDTSKCLIYADLIECEDKYPNALNHISKYKDVLLQRRECKTGARKWYMLQWGRKQDIFEKENIIFPYKSSSSRFAKASGVYYSADVYSISLNNDAGIDIDKLLRILNSSLYEFYFKSFAKKLGEDQYEYYPNTVMKMCIPVESDVEFISENELYDYFDLTELEILIVNHVM
ncbi:MAG: Eco57I restriction-modification methylase domain-containing protein [Solirubrobacterales bacterium]